MLSYIRLQLCKCKKESIKMINKKVPLYLDFKKPYTHYIYLRYIITFLQVITAPFGPAPN